MVAPLNPRHEAALAALAAAAKAYNSFFEDWAAGIGRRPREETDALRAQLAPL